MLVVGASQLKYLHRQIRGEDQGVTIRQVSGYRVQQFWSLIEEDVPRHKVGLCIIIYIGNKVYQGYFKAVQNLAPVPMVKVLVFQKVDEVSQS